MKKPLVAIVGRPNVGKSTFFNKICGKRISIVKNVPGVTRDRIYGDAEWRGHNFTIVDTGGLDFKSDDSFNINIINQVQIAIELADVIVFMVDGKEGLSVKDYETAEYLRKSKKPCVLVVNKLDNFEIEKSYEFYKLGIGDPIPISSEQSKGLGDALDIIISYFPNKFTDDQKDIIKVALVGKPNSGKSSLVNRLIGENRVIVSDISGTTRDAIDTPFRYKEQDYMLIDTAGIRKNNKINLGSIESYSILRSMEAIRRADVVLIVFDSSEPISEQDIRIAGFVHEEGKPSVIIMNKWDLVKKDDKTINKFNNKLKENLAFMDYFKSLYISALTGQRINMIMDTALEVLTNASKRITTSVLNEFLADAVLTNEPPVRYGKRLKIQYITQVSTNPPTFVLFCNDAKLMHYSYLRYLENKLRLAANFEGTPIKLIVKEKEKKE